MSPFDDVDSTEERLSRRGFLGRSTLGAGVFGVTRLLPQTAEAAEPEPEPGSLAKR